MVFNENKVFQNLCFNWSEVDFILTNTALLESTSQV